MSHVYKLHEFMEDDSTPENLAAARLVSYTTKAQAGDSELVRMYRSLKKEDPGKFLTRLENMEVKYAAARGKKEAGAVQGADAGTAECVGLVEKLLAGIEEKV